MEQLAEFIAKIVYGQSAFTGINNFYITRITNAILAFEQQSGCKVTIVKDNPKPNEPVDFSQETIFQDGG